MSRVAACLLLFVLASTAQAAWYPVFQPSYIQIRPGETVTVSVTGAWLSGVTVTPYTPMTVVSEDPAVATVDAFLPTKDPTPVRITAHMPGVTRVGVVERNNTAVSSSPVIVVAEEKLDVAVSIEGVLARGNTITLRAISGEPDATFTWYSGRLNGLYAWPVGTGRELTFTADFVSVYEYWVLVTSPHGAGASGVSLRIDEAPPPRRRAVRH